MIGLHIMMRHLTLLMKKMKSSEFINEQSLNANKKRLDKVIQKKQSWSVITTIIHPQLNHIDNSLNLINSMVYNDKTIIPYANEEIKRLSGVVDKLLLSVSSSRADSRMNKLQEMIDSKSDFDLDIDNHSDNAFNRFLKNSANSISSP